MQDFQSAGETAHYSRARAYGAREPEGRSTRWEEITRLPSAPNSANHAQLQQFSALGQQKRSAFAVRPAESFPSLAATCKSLRRLCGEQLVKASHQVCRLNNRSNVLIQAH